MSVPEYIARMEKDNVDHRYRSKRLAWHERRVFVEEFAATIKDQLEEKSIDELRMELRVLEQRRVTLAQTHLFLQHADLVLKYQQYVELCSAKQEAEAEQLVLQRMYRRPKKNTEVLLSSLKRVAMKVTTLRRESENLERELNERCSGIGVKFYVVVLGISTAKRIEQESP